VVFGETSFQLALMEHLNESEFIYLPLENTSSGGEIVTKMSFKKF